MFNASIRNREYTGQSTWFRQASGVLKEFLTSANGIGLICALVALGCLIGLPGGQYWNIRLPIYLIAVIWTLIRPRVALYLLPLAIPWGSLDTIGGMTSADILAALLAASWLLSYLLRPLATRGKWLPGPLDYEEAKTCPRAISVSMLIVLLMMVISTTVATNLFSSLKEIAKWTEVLIILLLGSQYLRTRKQIWTLAVVIIVAAVSQALLGYAQVFLNLGPTSFVRGQSLRVYGTFGQPNPFAGYINISLAIALALALLGSGKIKRLLALCVVLLLAGVEFYSQSKGGWLAILMGVIFIMLVGFPRWRIVFSILFIAVLCLIGVYLTGVVPQAVLDPFLTKAGLVQISFIKPTDASFANSERLAHWVAGLLMFQDHPFLGVGIGNYEDAYAYYAQGRFIVPLGHAHNYYINMAAETGIFGLTALIIFLISIGVAGSRSYKVINQRYREMCQQFSISTLTVSKSLLQAKGSLLPWPRYQNDRALAIGLLAALLTVCLHNLVDNLYVHSMTVLFALLCVMLVRLKDVQ